MVITWIRCGLSDLGTLQGEDDGATPGQTGTIFRGYSDELPKEGAVLQDTVTPGLEIPPPCSVVSTLKHPAS
jgi:hypothetical protein